MKKNYPIGKMILCTFLFWVISLLAIAQKNDLPIMKTPTSPIASSFATYGEIPVSKYTGIPDISIPLYTIEMGDMKVPIFLSYHPANVRLEAEASWVGLGWNLNVGGCITREVRGLDDFGEGGHWWRFHTSGLTSEYTQPIPDTYDDYSDFFKNIRRYDISCSNPDGIVMKRMLKMDGEPDVFYYNFGGYSGRFVIKGSTVDEVILEKPEDNLKIEFNTDSWEAKISIVVTLPSGEKLTFDVAEESISYSSANSIFDMGAIQGTKSLSTWYLSSIELLDSRKITFKYETKNNIQRNVFSTQIKIVDNLNEGIIPAFMVEKALTSAEIPSDKCGGIYALPELSPFSNKIDVHGCMIYSEHYLKTISWDGNRINFSHSPRSDYGTYIGANNIPLKLDAIEVFNQQGKRVKAFSFGYSYFTSNFSKPNADKMRLKLDCLTEYSLDGTLPSYKFSYDTRADLPPKTSLCCDVWGYYNGTSAPASGNLYPEIIQRAANQCFFNWEYPACQGRFYEQGRNVRCNPDYTTTGMLTKIEYPTGGCAEFTFEANTYISHFDGTEKKGGGVRIAKIKTDAVERIFDYNDGGRTSGVLLIEPIFFYSISMPGTTQHLFSSRSVVQLQGHKMGNCVGYRKVTETKADGNTKLIEVEHYKSEKEQMDGYSFLYTYDYYGRNGLLMKKELYHNDLLSQKIEYSYSEMSPVLRQNMRAMKFDEGIFYWYDVFPHCYWQQTRQCVTDYFSDRNMVTNNYYAYNDQNGCVNITETEVGDKRLIKRITYSSDLSSGSFEGMKQKHITNKPVEETDYIKTGDTESVIGSRLVLYDNYGFPKTVYSLETNCPLPDFVSFKNLSGDGRDSRYSSMPEAELSYGVDSWFGFVPEESVDRRGVHTVYVWSYNCNYIVAKIENATLADVKNKLPFYESLKQETRLSDNHIQQLNSLRGSLPDAFVTTYIYDSLVGITESTDPRGLTTYYKYDGFGRLKETYWMKNGVKQLIYVNDYHYRNQ